MQRVVDSAPFDMLLQGDWDNDCENEGKEATWTRTIPSTAPNSSRRAA